MGALRKAAELGPYSEDDDAGNDDGGINAPTSFLRSFSDSHIHTRDALLPPQPLDPPSDPSFLPWRSDNAQPKLGRLRTGLVLAQFDLPASQVAHATGGYFERKGIEIRLREKEKK